MPAPSTFNGTRGTLNAKHPASATSCLDSTVGLNKTKNNLEVIVSKNTILSEYYLSLYDKISNSKKRNNAEITSFVESKLQHASRHTIEVAKTLMSFEDMVDKDPDIIRYALLERLGSLIESLQTVVAKSINQGEQTEASKSALVSLRRYELSYLSRKKDFYELLIEKGPSQIAGTMPERKRIVEACDKRIKELRKTKGTKTVDSNDAEPEA